MASILDRYGIKEVCDFTFYTIDDSTGKPSVPALYLDTLKVSTIEQTADTVESKGGKGNVTLLSWDTNKEITVTVEDALFSAKSLAIMFGNGSLKSYSNDNAYIMRTETFTATANAVPASAGWSDKYEGPDGKTYTKINPKFYEEDGTPVEGTTSTVILTEGETYFCSYDILVSGSVVEIGANTFPGTYYCVGDTYARNAKSGRDEFFQFIIPKAKVQSGNTITLQAEGDPSTFSMNLKVMKPDDGIMMKLVKYDAENGTPATAESNIAQNIYHNHELSYGTVEITGTTAKSIYVKELTATGHCDGYDTDIVTAAAGAGVVTLTGKTVSETKTTTVTVYDKSDEATRTKLGTISVTVNPAQAAG